MTIMGQEKMINGSLNIVDYEDDIRTIDMLFSIMVDYLELHQEEEFAIMAVLELAHIIQKKIKNILLLEDS